MARKKKTNEDQPQENSDNINESDDNFGLPEIEYKPLNREEKQEEPVEIEQVEEVTVTTTEYEGEVIEERHEDHIFNPTEEESSPLPKIIGVLVVLLLLAAGIWFFMVYQPKQRAQALAEKQKQEQLDRDRLAKEEADRVERKRVEDEQRRADSLANAKPAIGTIETLSGRTRRYYVVVASSIDDDLLMDYAKKLSLKGISTQIIPPFGKVKFSRIAVASGDTYADAQSTADGLKSEYEDGAWVVKY